MTPAPLAAALIAVLVPAAAVAVTLLALRGVTVEPLGVVRNRPTAAAGCGGGWCCPPSGALLLVPLARARPWRDTPLNTFRLAAGAVLLLFGVTALLPWLVEAVVGRLRGGPVPWQLAVRRLQLSSGTAARAVSGITVAVAGAIAAPYADDRYAGRLRPGVRGVRQAPADRPVGQRRGLAADPAGAHRAARHPGGDGGPRHDRREHRPAAGRRAPPRPTHRTRRSPWPTAPSCANWPVWTPAGTARCSSPMPRAGTPPSRPGRRISLNPRTPPKIRSRRAPGRSPRRPAVSGCSTADAAPTASRTTCWPRRPRSTPAGSPPHRGDQGRLRSRHPGRRGAHPQHRGPYRPDDERVLRPSTIRMTSSTPASATACSSAPSSPCC